MNYKMKSIGMLEEIIEIGKTHDVSAKVLENLIALKTELINFKVAVPLMGGFNAGKTSLINHFLQNDKLPTDITPETTIAAEIKFGESEKIIAHAKTGETRQFALHEIKQIRPSEFRYIEVFQNHPALKKLSDIVLVDMPGLDSSVEAHNQAILNYIRDDVFYILLVDAESGLKESVINFLKEIDLYQIDFAVLITKTDKKLPQDNENVKETVRQAITNITGKEIFVGAVSVIDDHIADFEHILTSLDVEAFTRNAFQSKILAQFEKVMRELDNRVKYQSVDVSEIETHISQINQQIKELALKLDEEARRIEDEFGNTALNKMLEEIKSNLRMNMPLLISAAKRGSENFSQTINDIIRPVLVTSLEDNISLVLDHSFENFDDMINNLTGTFGKFKMAISAFAITTNIIAPWLEVIILFLPEIVKIFFNHDEQIRKQIEEQVIPKISLKLAPEIKHALAQIKSEFIQRVKTEIDEHQQGLIASMNQAIDEKKMATEDFQRKHDAIKKDLELLKQYRSECVI